MSIEANDLDAVNYKNGQKNNWRRTMWNVVREWTPHPNEALVLYLPGAANLDRPVAESKGFRSINMIAVERDSKVASQLREHDKQIVLNHDLKHVMTSWPCEHPVSVVIADLVSGYDINSIDIIMLWLGMFSFANSTLILNMQRGREKDAPSRLARRDFDPDHRQRLRDVAARFDISENSRALLAYMFFPTLADYIHQRFDHPEPMYVVKSNPTNTDFYRLNRDQFWMTKFLPSYRSGKVVMDSIAFRCLGKFDRRLAPGKTPMKKNERAEARAYGIANERPDVSAASLAKTMLDIWRSRRSISAALAMRTMRLNGQL